MPLSIISLTKWVIDRWRINSWLPDSAMLGRNVSVVLSLTDAALNFQTSTPSAIPAAIAAPRAVVSGIEGRTTNHVQCLHKDHYSFEIVQFSVKYKEWQLTKYEISYITVTNHFLKTRYVHVKIFRSCSKNYQGI